MFWLFQARPAASTLAAAAAERVEDSRHKRAALNCIGVARVEGLSSRLFGRPSGWSDSWLAAWIDAWQANSLSIDDDNGAAVAAGIAAVVFLWMSTGCSTHRHELRVNDRNAAADRDHTCEDSFMLPIQLCFRKITMAQRTQ